MKTPKLYSPDHEDSRKIFSPDHEDSKIIIINTTLAIVSPYQNSVYVTPLKGANRLAPTGGKGKGGEWGQLAQQLTPFRVDPSHSPCGIFTIL